jgi:signal transduction histidine kinase
MAHELHEDIGQRLSLLAIEMEQLKADSLSSAGVSSRMDALLKQALEILTEVKARGT